MHVSRSSCNLVLAILTAACLAACGGGDDAPNVVSYRIGGTVSGLGAGKRVVLQNNGGDDLTVTSNGAFNFSTSLTGGAAYAVTVKMQPDGQTCTVTHGNGNTAAADVSNVSVACSTGSTPPDTGNGSPTQGVAGVLGVWVQDLCVVANGKGNRQYVSVTKTADNAITFDQGVMSYAATNCSGTGSTMPGSVFSAGQVVFSRSGSTATLAANWGVWIAANTQHPIIWAVKANSKLCQVGDATPSTLPTAADVEGYANLMIPNGACYTKQ